MVIRDKVNLMVVIVPFHADTGLTTGQPIYPKPFITILPVVSHLLFLLTVLYHPPAVLSAPPILFRAKTAAPSTPELRPSLGRAKRTA